ncbi:3'(2'),5'-bisphosphate nucleotidase CysQ [Aquamicrobium defluvii]|uniref:Inositol monophosphatase n=1 Tax=Aquamicrobium defluvii TaxID=69279 RepID=A0A011USN3_9HYPH|nr:3'(2'),5'-bisphosphate nucleotidase CysQ [Aquamicrobium defluvii]EXL08853.1 inositol monophosphatase [Aquamicrobium defluvii]EZQ15053.1 inositol monophosphatase [Halopseudomonas bauzanensis]TDR35381.1 myo-inositol-1(or 4)-monophosphatase [Aquamicrobium defluvii]
MPEVDARSLPSPEEDLALLRDAAREAGRIAMGYFGKDPQVWIKEGTSPVSEADYAADRFLRETLLEARPRYGWLSEETVDDPGRLKAPRTFVVDPIDGTRAFIAGNPTWCVSVAVVEQGRSLAGVLDCPARNEVFWATRGGGAFLDGRRLDVATTESHPSIAGPKSLIDRLDPGLIAQSRRVDYVPSLAYRLAMIADGRIDASFVKSDSHDWDLAAAALILEEAGGTLLDSGGDTPRFAMERIRHGELVAGSGELLRKLFHVIAGPEDVQAQMPV